MVLGSGATKLSTGTVSALKVKGNVVSDSEIGLHGDR